MLMLLNGFGNSNISEQLGVISGVSEGGEKINNNNNKNMCVKNTIITIIIIKQINKTK